MKRTYMVRRTIAAILALAVVAVTLLSHPNLYQPVVVPQTPSVRATGDAATTLNQLEVKGRAPKTNYSRDQFGDGWELQQGCDMRNIILNRDLTDVTTNAECKVVKGTLHDPYTGKDIMFIRGETTSDDVQIDHVVALSDAWQTGAQQLAFEERVKLANDPLELLAVDGSANQQKSDGDAATWLPANKAFRCQYVARQIAVKQKYRLWVKPAEKDAMLNVLSSCPGQKLPVN